MINVQFTYFSSTSYVKSKPNQTLVFEVLARSEEEQVIAQKTVLLDRNSLAISGYMNGI